MPFDSEPESHPSFGLAGFNRVSSTPGRKLFDSSVPHQHYVVLRIHTAQRKRDLHHDWIHADEDLIEISMSEAQFGALVSSFGNGDGVPVTITRLGRDQVPEGPHESRLAVTAKEVAVKARKATEDVRAAMDRLTEAIDDNAGKRAVRAALRDLEIRVGNLPSNMQFAADALTGHTENVVTKARADIEAMVQAAAQRAGLELGSVDRILELTPATDEQEQ